MTDHIEPEQAPDPLSQLLQRCLDAEARRRLEEAVRCYNAELPRQCIVTTWQAVVIDYVRKLEKLRALNNGKAKEVLSKYENAIDTNNPSPALSLEKGLVKEAVETFGFIPNAHQADFERLFEDRNRAAHPAMTAVGEPMEFTQAQALRHMEVAVSHLLGRPPVHGKAAAEEVERTITAPGFPVKLADAERVLKESPLHGGRRGLLRAVLHEQVTRIVRDKAPGRVGWQRIAAVTAIRNMRRAEFDELMPETLKGVLTGGPFNPRPVLALLWFSPDFWELLPASVQDLLSQFVREAVPASDGDDFLVFASRVSNLQADALRRAAELPEAQIKQLAEKPGRADYARLILAGVLANPRKGFLYETLSKWPDLVDVVEPQDALALAKALPPGTVPAVPAVAKNVSTDQPPDIITTATMAAAMLFDLSFSTRWQRVITISTRLRARLRRLCADPAVPEAVKAQMRRAEEELETLEKRLSPTSSLPSPPPSP